MRLALVLVIACGTAGQDDFGKRRLAKVQCDTLAKQNYPRWAISHPDQAFPTSAKALALDDDSLLLDPWGRDFKLVCGEAAPAAVRGCGVSSLGPDGHDNTADDVRSWELGP